MSIANPVFSLPWSRVFVLAIALIGYATSVRSQEQLMHLDPPKLDKDEKATFASLVKGDKDWDDQHKKLMLKVAQWHLYRLTLKTVQEESLKESSVHLTPLAAARIPTLNEVVAEVSKALSDAQKANPKDPDKTRKFLLEFGKALISTSNEVLKNPAPIARVNAARVLARLGETGIEEFAGDMAKVIRDKDQNDAVKLYALRGMKELFTPVDPLAKNQEMRFGSAKTFNNKEMQLDCVQALIEFIHRPSNLPPDASTPEVEAFRFVRREAVRALAQVRSPMLLRKKEVVAKPALELLRVVCKDGFVPEPSLTEQLEAAIGIGMMQLQPKLFPDYHPDYAAEHVGHFLADFGARCSVDRRDHPLVIPKLGEEPKPPPLLAWRFESIRLQRAMETMKAESKAEKSDKPDKYVTDMDTQVNSVLRAMEDPGKPIDVLKLKDWLDANKPEHQMLFKGDETSVVKRAKTE